ncbi:MAG: PilZ domain-containing protein [Nitrospiraceae bacterium]|nr:MAG: PilZ domain-containing protein [Nitrospiraceae bacterium]
MEKDQRRNKRVPIAASARISYTGNRDAKTIDRTVACISFPGIGLYADCMPAKGTAVTVEISFITTAGLLKTNVIKGTIVNANEVGELCYI